MSARTCMIRKASQCSEVLSSGLYSMSALHAWDSTKWLRQAQMF